jgi:primosomal protein N' (replication factor Y)
VAEVAQRGPTLVVVPSLERAGVLAERLRRAGGGVALIPDEWPQARAGAAVVIGSRAAAWGPCPDLAAAIVLDGHDEGLGQEQAPTWHAVTVVAERARRASAPCLIISACPTVELLAMGPLITVERTAERAGWAGLEVVDRRGDDPRLGLYSESLVRLIRAEARVLCVLNRTGGGRLLACRACGAIARCEACGAAVAQSAQHPARELKCPSCGTARPRMCHECDSTRLKFLRVGVTRAREELEALAGREVVEITGASPAVDPAHNGQKAEVVVGTEAALHRFSPADRFLAVAFLDFDQELLASRVRAADEAVSLLAHASRLVKGRAGRVLVQTRIPDHPVIRAALLADPAILSDDQMEVRKALALPPFTAVAVVSGPGAPEYAGGLQRLAGSPVAVLGPDGDRWLIKAPDITVLADALGAVPRTAARLRVAVEPARM